jgi:hypothetical protein
MDSHKTLDIHRCRKVLACHGRKKPEQKARATPIGTISSDDDFMPPPKDKCDVSFADPPHSPCKPHKKMCRVTPVDTQSSPVRRTSRSNKPPVDAKGKQIENKMLPPHRWDIKEHRFSSFLYEIV